MIQTALWSPPPPPPPPLAAGCNSGTLELGYRSDPYRTCWHKSRVDPPSSFLPCTPPHLPTSHLPPTGESTWKWHNSIRFVTAFRGGVTGQIPPAPQVPASGRTRNGGISGTAKSTSESTAESTASNEDTCMSDGWKRHQPIDFPLSLISFFLSLLCFVFQIGCFVPARRASFRIVDQMFSRVGAGDHVRNNASSFALEVRFVSFSSISFTPFVQTQVEESNTRLEHQLVGGWVVKSGSRPIEPLWRFASSLSADGNVPGRFQPLTLTVVPVAVVPVVAHQLKVAGRAVEGERELEGEPEVRN